MKILTLTLIAFVLLFATKHLQAQSTCVADTNHIYKFTYNSKKYEVVKETKSWVNAAACAKERGGYLVQIADTAEQIAVYNAITIGAAIASNYTTVNDGGGIAYVWIGATDMAVEGSWIWDGDNDSIGTNFYTGEGNNTTGTGVETAGQFANWGSVGGTGFNEPDNYSNVQDAAAIALAGWPSGSGSIGVASQWNDINPTNQLYYVIEYNSSSNGINQIKNSGFEITPNPVNDVVQIKANTTAPYVVNLIAMNGKTVATHQLTGVSSTINIATLPAGIYIIRIENKDGLYFQKIVKR